MSTGKVKLWFEDRGFGFVIPDEGGVDVFCHIRSVIGGHGKLVAGERVEFREAISDRNGKPEAKDVRLIGM